jgi:hypothetical protein
VSIQILGTDGNAMTSRDVDGSASNFIYVSGKLVFSGSYTSGVGDSLNWTTIADKIASDECISCAISTQTVGNNYVAQGSYATALGSWIVRCQTPGALSELATGAYPSGITGDTVTFTAVFRKLY